MKPPVSGAIPTVPKLRMRWPASNETLTGSLVSVCDGGAQFLNPGDRS
jgi:hypothetical protein